MKHMERFVQRKCYRLNAAIYNYTIYYIFSSRLSRIYCILIAHNVYLTLAKSIRMQHAVKQYLTRYNHSYYAAY